MHSTGSITTSFLRHAAQTALRAASVIMILSLSSCVKTTLTPVPDPSEVAFSVYNPSTKAGATGAMTTDNLKERGFGVFAYYTDDATYETRSPLAPNFMYNQQVAHDGTAWSYDPIKYWPNEDADNVSYFAYAPYVANADVSVGSVSGNTSSGIVAMSSNSAVSDPYVTYRVAEGGAEGVDLLWATGTDGLPMANLKRADRKVDFHFRHALAKLSVTARVEVDGNAANALSVNTYVLIKSLKVSGPFPKQARLNLNNAEAGVPLWVSDGSSVAQDVAVTIDPKYQYDAATEGLFPATTEQYNPGANNGSGFASGAAALAALSGKQTIPVGGDGVSLLSGGSQLLIPALDSDEGKTVSVEIEFVTLSVDPLLKHSNYYTCIPYSKTHTATFEQKIRGGMAYGLELVIRETSVKFDWTTSQWGWEEGETSGGTAGILVPENDYITFGEPTWQPVGTLHQYVVNSGAGTVSEIGVPGSFQYAPVDAVAFQASGFMNIPNSSGNPLVYTDSDHQYIVEPPAGEDTWPVETNFMWIRKYLKDGVTYSTDGEKYRFYSVYPTALMNSPKPKETSVSYDTRWSFRVQIGSNNASSIGAYFCSYEGTYVLGSKNIIPTSFKQIMTPIAIVSYGLAPGTVVSDVSLQLNRDGSWQNFYDNGNYNYDSATDKWSWSPETNPNYSPSFIEGGSYTITSGVNEIIGRIQYCVPEQNCSGARLTYKIDGVQKTVEISGVEFNENEPLLIYLSPDGVVGNYIAYHTPSVSAYDQTRIYSVVAGKNGTGSITSGAATSAPASATVSFGSGFKSWGFASDGTALVDSPQTISSSVTNKEWPENFAGEQYKFWSVYSGDESAVSVTGTAASYSTAPTIRYTWKSGNQLLESVPASASTYSEGDRVSSSFAPLLTPVSLYAADIKAGVKVTRVELKNVTKVATHTLGSGSWTSAEKGSIVLFDGDYLSDGNPAQIGDTQYLIPQDLSGATLEVTVDGAATKTIPISLSGSWVAGQPWRLDISSDMGPIEWITFGTPTVNSSYTGHSATISHSGLGAVGNDGSVVSGTSFSKEFGAWATMSSDLLSNYTQISNLVTSYHWPAEASAGDSFKVWAVYPYSAVTGSSLTSPAPSFTYTAASSSLELFVAKKTNGSYKSGDASTTSHPIATSFTPALARLAFVTGSVNSNVEIKNLTVKSLYKAGKYEYNTGGWTATGARSDEEVYSSFISGGVAGTPIGADIYIVPQSLSGLSITATLTNGTDDETINIDLGALSGTGAGKLGYDSFLPGDRYLFAISSDLASPTNSKSKEIRFGLPSVVMYSKTDYIAFADLSNDNSGVSKTTDNASAPAESLTSFKVIAKTESNSPLLSSASINSSSWPVASGAYWPDGSGNVQFFAFSENNSSGGLDYGSTSGYLEFLSDNSPSLEALQTAGYVDGEGDVVNLSFTPRTAQICFRVDDASSSVSVSSIQLMYVDSQTNGNVWTNKWNSQSFTIDNLSVDTGTRMIDKSFNVIPQTFGSNTTIVVNFSNGTSVSRKLNSLTLASGTRTVFDIQLPAGGGGGEEGTVVWEGSENIVSWENHVIGSENDWLNANLRQGDIVRLYINSSAPEWQLQIFSGHWGDALMSFNNSNYDMSSGYIAFEVTSDLYSIFTDIKGWGSALILQGYGGLELYKITIVSAE